MNVQARQKVNNLNNRMSMYILGNERWWTGGNDIAVEGEWVWPEENVTVLSGFTDWDSGNVFLCFRRDE